jgi:hypothetical protein
MAKGKKLEEGVIVDNVEVVQETAEVTTEGNTEEVIVEEVSSQIEEVEVVETTDTEEVVLVSAITKMVTIKALETHTCIIAQKEYSITKGKEHKIPEDVAYILAGSLKAVITK